jgi:hypothetical protein
MRIAIVIGCVLAAIVLVNGYREGGSAGPCAPGTDFVRHNSGARFRAEHQTFPPARVCVATDRFGEEVSTAFPTLADYGLALVAFLLPAALLDAWRRRRGPLRALRDRSAFQHPGFWGALLCGCLLSLIAWTGTFFPSGRGGVCDLSGPIGTFSCHHEGRLFPPSQRFEFRDNNGKVLATGVRPEPHQWLVVAGWFVLPFVVWGYASRITRWRARAKGSRSRSPA